MTVARSPELERRPRAVAIGTFDGVHLGHRAVFEPTSTPGGARPPSRSHPHPRMVLGYQVELLATLERRLELLAALRDRGALVVEFTPESRGAGAGGVRARLPRGARRGGRRRRVGFRFGRRRSGDLDLLRALGLDARQVPLVEGVSSTRSGARPRGRGRRGCTAARAPVRARRRPSSRATSAEGRSASRRRTCGSTPELLVPRVRDLRGRGRRPPGRGLDRRQPALRRLRAADRGLPARLARATSTANGSCSSSGAAARRAGVRERGRARRADRPRRRRDARAP